MNRYDRAWDYHQQAGLILAGSRGRWSNTVERSKNYGQTFTQLPDIPYRISGAWGTTGACMVILDADTALLIGGQFTREFLI